MSQVTAVSKFKVKCKSYTIVKLHKDLRSNGSPSVENPFLITIINPLSRTSCDISLKNE